MNLQTVAVYVLRALAQSQTEGRASNLATLTDELQVRRKDVRTALTTLHRQGYVDVLRMRLTLEGFAVGRALVGQRLVELRPTQVPVVKAVAA